MAIRQPSSEKYVNAMGSTRGRCRVHFEVDAEPGSHVAVAGNFNDWNPKAHVLKETKRPGHFERYVYLQPGNYQYKFVIDGSWSADPNCPSFTPNDFGTLNSVLKVQRAPVRRGGRSQASASNFQASSMNQDA